MRSVVKYTGIGAIKLRFDMQSISAISRKHIKILLDQIVQLKLIDKDGIFERQY